MANRTNTKSASASAASKAKPTIVEDVSATHEDETFSAFSQMFSEAFAIKYPWLGVIVNLSVFALGAYSGVQVAMWLGLMVTVMTTSAFLGGLVTFLVALTTIIQSLRAGAAVGRYVSTGQFEDDYQSAKDWVSSKLSWFGRTAKAV